MGQPTSTAKPTFESCIPEIKRIVASRKGGWTHVSLMEWQDVASNCMIRIMKQWYLYDHTRPLENWCNTLISNVFKNLKRDLVGRYSRPCVGGGKANGASCAYNTGGDACSAPWVKSRTQCDECPLFAEWHKTRRHQFNIKSTVTLENHVQEVHNQPQDFCDIEGIQNTLHEKMKEELTTWEYRVYACLYIKHLSPNETSAALEAVTKKWKRLPRAEERFDYQFILEQQRWCKQMLFLILKREGYDLEAALNHDRRTR